LQIPALTSRLGGTHSAVEAGISRHHKGARAVAKIERPLLSRLLPGRSAPLPARQPGWARHVMPAFVRHTSEQRVQLLNRGQRPIGIAAQSEGAAVVRGLARTHSEAVVRRRPHEFGLRIHPVASFFCFARSTAARRGIVTCAPGNLRSTVSSQEAPPSTGAATTRCSPAARLTRTSSPALITPRASAPTLPRPQTDLDLHSFYGTLRGRNPLAN